MAANGQIELNWGDGTHQFNIAKLKCVLELEEKCDAGIAQIFKRVMDGTWKMNDIRETLRLGLIGGGMPPTKALPLISRYVDDRPWQESLQPAMAVLLAAMVGVQGDEVGKKPETEQAQESRSSPPMADTSAPSSTDSERQFISHPVN